MSEVDELEPLEKRVKEVGWPYTRSVSFDGDPHIIVEYPNGTARRAVYYYADNVDEVLDLDFDRYLFLGDYEALVHTATGLIEARVAPLGGPLTGSFGLTRRLARIPGVEILEGATEKSDDAEDVTEELPSSRLPDNWRLRVSRGAAVIELSPMSKEFATVLIGATDQLRATTLKISGISSASHDEAVKLLEVVSGSFFFDLDLRYEAAIGLMSRRLPPWRRRQASITTQPPAFPDNRYPAEPLALYMYARSASGLPLLEFLAYYQALEFFFPVFSKEELARQLQRTLTDPRFDPRSDSEIGRVLSLVSPGRGVTSEREQLRATVQGSVDVNSLQEFVASSERFTQHFCDKKQAIQGVQRLLLEGGQADLRNQVADRLYAIRCRIVHTKQDGGDSGVDLLMPSSREARSLGPDIALGRLVAEHALIARASNLQV